MAKTNFPTYANELRYLVKYRYIAGADEVGVGPLAGPVVAAAVILDPKKIGRLRSRSKWWYQVRDSKLLPPKKREELAGIIYKNCLSVGIACATVEEIDRLNILRARLLAMKRAVEGLRTVPDFLLVDGHLEVPGILIPQRSIIKGDVSVLSIACASIMAKVTRDNICDRLHRAYPEYGFDQHKGYPTRLHFNRLKQFGPCAEHRKTFTPVKLLLEKSGETISFKAPEKEYI